jgi:hypothetical protein
MVLGYACSVALGGSWVVVRSQTEVTAKMMYFGLCECHYFVSATLHGVMLQKTVLIIHH